MTTTQLKANILEARPASKFFSRENMKFSGDTMRNYGVCRTTIKSEYNEHGAYNGEPKDIEVWELYRKRPVKHGLKTSHFFHVETFREIFDYKEPANI